MSSRKIRGRAAAVVVVLLAAALAAPAVFAQLGARVHTFTAGETVQATKMNENFTAVLREVDALKARLGVVEGRETIPQGMVAMFDGACPSGWAAYHSLDGRFARGASSPGGIGGSDRHTHTIPRGGYSVNGDAPSGILGGTIDIQNGADEGITRDPVSREASHLPPYRDVLWCEKR